MWVLICNVVHSLPLCVTLWNSGLVYGPLLSHIIQYPYPIYDGVAEGDNLKSMMDQQTLANSVIKFCS